MDTFVCRESILDKLLCKKIISPQKFREMTRKYLKSMIDMRKILLKINISVDTVLSQCLQHNW